MKNVKELRDETIKLTEGLKSGEIGLKMGRVMISAYKTILQTASEQRIYNEYCQSKKEVKFLDSNE